MDATAARRYLPPASTAGGLGTAVQDQFGWEMRLRRFTYQLLKSMRRVGIRVSRLTRRTVQYWISWLLQAGGLLAAGALLSAVDLRLLRVWRLSGARMAARYVLVGSVLFLRLLLEPRRRVPLAPRVALAGGIVYGLLPRDLVADSVLLLGWLDDIVLIAVLSRWFVRRCPDRIVDGYAARVQEGSEDRAVASP